MKYHIIPHHNSNNARRRGLCGPRFNPKTGLVEYKNHVSIQVVRGGDSELLKGVNPAVARYMGGRYQVPFVGRKQQRKLEGIR